MSADHCEHWRGIMAQEVVGQLEDAQRAALDAHVDQCTSCREERTGLSGLSAALAGTHVEHLEPPALPLELGRSVLGFLGAAERAERSGRRRRRVLAGVVAAACAALVGLALSVGGGSPGRTVALTGDGAPQATAVLTAESWGTSIEVSETDPRAGSLQTLWMRTRSGAWWEAGSYRVSAGRSLEVTMACAVPAAEITEIWVRDAQGRTTLRGYVS